MMAWRRVVPTRCFKDVFKQAAQLSGRGGTLQSRQTFLRSVGDLAPGTSEDFPMMRSSYAIGHASILMKTPNYRRQAERRRLTVVCAILALALASGLVGSLIHPAATLSSRPATGPFSYIPSE
jgi:hypothetical protein